MRKLMGVLFLAAVCVPNAFGWGQEGHRIVCRIAYQSLTDAERQEVDRLTHAYKLPDDADLEINSFPDACIFADAARVKVRDAQKAGSTDSPWLQYKDFNDWHFLNVARSVRSIPEDACDNDCVLEGIAQHSKMLKSGATDQERGEGLFFLGHWLGDVHQPLHVSYSDDQGGNTVQPVSGGFYPVNPKFPLNLHAVWDSGMIRIAIKKPGWRRFADRLQKRIKEEKKTGWLDSEPLDWAQESYDITRSRKVQYCRPTNTSCQSFGQGRMLTAKYQKEFLDDVELRLQKAGTRLAALISEALAEQ